MIDLFDLYQQGQVGKLHGLQVHTDARLTGTADKVRDLEHRYERLRLITMAMWQLLKEHTSLTDADLKRFVEKVDLIDGKSDGRVSRSSGAMDCPKCSRRVLQSATVCVWCGGKLSAGNAFQST
jgi:hypothetical protein